MILEISNFIILDAVRPKLLSQFQTRLLPVSNNTLEA